MSSSEIFHLATGGTIDSYWNAPSDTALPNRETVVERYLREAVRFRGVASETLFMKDSRQVTPAMQDQAADRIAEVPYDRMLVTSGTYLMPDIGRTIKRHPGVKGTFDSLDRRLVLTGSGKPMHEFLRSDGGFNLGMSVAVLEEDTVDRVTAVMNGGCFEVDALRKDLTTATFGLSEGDDQIPYADFDLIALGGSMDFVPNGLDGLVPARQSQVPGYLRTPVQNKHHFVASNPFVRDSRELITEEDLARVLEMISRTKTDYILITTGIYRIRELQQFLSQRLGEENNKRIILTGSRLPLGITDMTDAPFNLGYALGKLGFLQPGVHVALQGHIFEDDEDILNTVYTPREIELIREQSRRFETHV